MACSTFCCVRKHQAPKGALRRCFRVDAGYASFPVRKHQAPIGALRLTNDVIHSARGRLRVRKRRAPNGVLRLCTRVIFNFGVVFVRKHRAPKGALRLRVNRRSVNLRSRHLRKHRAPKGALRPSVERSGHVLLSGVRKHRAPNGALRRQVSCHTSGCPERSESTERQKVH